MVGIETTVVGESRTRLNDGLSHNAGARESMYLQISEDTPLRCTAIVGDHGLQSHQYHSTYEVDPVRAEAQRELIALYNLRRMQRQNVRYVTRLVKSALLAAARERFTYTVPRFYYRKVVEFRTRPVYRWKSIHITYVVTRKKLLRKIPYKHRVVWYTTIVIRRKRGIIRKKRRHEKVITLYKRKWKIWQETHKKRWGREKVFVRMKVYRKAYRIKTPLPPRTVFMKDAFLEYLRYEVDADIRNHPTYQDALTQLNRIDTLIVSQLLRLRSSMQFRDNRCLFFGTTTLLEATSQELIKTHRFTANYGSVFLPKGYGPGSVPIPTVHKYSRSAGTKEYYYMVAYDEDGRIVASGFPGAEESPSAFFYRGFGPTPTSLPGTRAGYEHLHALADVSSVSINDPLLAAKTQGAMWSATTSLLNGRINGADDKFVLTRSVGELKDTEQTVSTMREALEWAKAQDASSPAAKRLTALERKWASASTGARGAESLSKLKAITGGKLSLPRGSLIYAAGLYCCYRFALEPTVQDILTVLNDWKKALFGLRSNLAKMLSSLDDPHVDSITLKKAYHSHSEPQTIKLPEYSPMETTLQFSFDGPDTTGEHTDTYDLYLGTDLIKSVVKNKVTYQCDGAELFSSLAAPGRLIVHYYEDREGLVFNHVAGDDLFALIGEDIRTWRDAVEQTLERAKFLETIWELLPLSFILDWFVTTRSSVTNLHNLVMTWYSGTYEYRESMWATQAVRKINTKSFASAMTFSAEDVVLSRPVSICGCSSKKAYEEGRIYPLWTVYQQCSIKLHAVRYWPAALAADGEYRTRYFGRGPCTAATSIGGLIHSLIPLPKVHLSLGKLASLTAVLVGILGGRKR